MKQPTKMYGVEFVVSSEVTKASLRAEVTGNSQACSETILCTLPVARNILHSLLKVSQVQ